MQKKYFLYLKNDAHESEDGDLLQLEDTHAVPHFPQLTLDEVRELTFGVYQVKQAENYVCSHMDEDGNYEVNKTIVEI